MANPPSTKTVARPKACPVCHSKIFETLAKVITESAMWRCRSCEKTWTIAGLAASLPRPR